MDSDARLEKGMGSDARGSHANDARHVLVKQGMDSDANYAGVGAAKKCKRSDPRHAGAVVSRKRWPLCVANGNDAGRWLVKSGVVSC